MSEERVRISVRVTQEEKEKAEHSAALCGLSQSAFLRQLCMGKTPKPKPPKAFWEMLNALYEVHTVFKSCIPYHPAAAQHCKEIETVILLLQEAG